MDAANVAKPQLAPREAEPATKEQAIARPNRKASKELSVRKAKRGAKKTVASVPARAKAKRSNISGKLAKRAKPATKAARIPGLRQPVKLGRPQKGEEAKTLAALAPWKAAKVSRATFFRRKKAETKSDA